MSTEVVLGDIAPTPVTPTAVAAHPLEYDRWSHVGAGPIDRSVLDTFIHGLPEGVLRAKGLVHLSEDPEHRYILQVVGHRGTLTPDPQWVHGEERETRLVVIAAPGALDHERLTASMWA
ncbi:MAG: cobalamin biosynthesis protein CobW [Acidimicrobiales bacterium]|nr:MAG: cobalamin biosynthesis protein CobW [Acidimicrobiales bacterium]